MKTHKALISLGSNKNSETSLKKMASLFRVWVKDVKASPTLDSDAIGMKDNAPIFTNQLLELNTTLSAEELNTLCKKAEMLCGNTTEQRKKGNIIADADLLLCGEEKYHKSDWQHGYIKNLLKTLGAFLVILLITSFSAHAPLPQTSDKEMLGMAIEYFGAQKYHEALLIFDKLEKKHRLSARLKAYKGVCLFKESEYDKAKDILSFVLPELNKYPPHEIAIYNYTCGESYFQLGRYEDGIPYFRKALDVSLENNKAEICYRLGFSEMMQKNEEKAIEWFSKADTLYAKTEHDEITHAHQAQNKRMLRYLLVAHRASGMDSGNEIAGENEYESTDNDSTTINKEPDRQ